MMQGNFPSDEVGKPYTYPVGMAKKVWFITGSSRGFGRHWAEAALQRGDLVAATARDTSSLTGLVETYGDAVLPLQLDVTDQVAARDTVAQTHKTFGRLDVVVNNAGYGLAGELEEVSEEQARAQMETNFFGALWITQAVLPYMREQGSGHIVQVSSIGGICTYPGFSLYHASKWALEGMSESLAQEVAGFGIHVTLVEPGPFATDWAGSSDLAKTRVTNTFPNRWTTMGYFRRHPEFGVMAKSEKALKSVQTWLPDFSALYRSTKFGMASFFRQLNQLYWLLKQGQRAFLVQWIGKVNVKQVLAGFGQFPGMGRLTSRLCHCG